MIEFTIDGGIGWKNENGRVELKYNGDRVRSDKATEQRLVDEGRAKYVPDTEPVNQDETKTKIVKEEIVEEAIAEEVVAETVKPEKTEKSKNKNKKESKAEEEPPILSAADPE